MRLPIATSRVAGLMGPGHAERLAAVETLVGTANGAADAAQATADAAMPKAGGTFTGSVTATVVPITDAASIVLDLGTLAAGNLREWTIPTGVTARTLAAPVNVAAGVGLTGILWVTNASSSAVAFTITTSGTPWKLDEGLSNVVTMPAGSYWRLSFGVRSATRVSLSYTQEAA